MRPMAKLYRRPQRWTPALGALLCWVLATAALADGTHGLSLFGDLKYRPDFKHYDYVNPNAPKGGTMKFSAIGTYDTLNPFVVKGIAASNVGQIFDTLMLPSQDEPSSEYGLVAESVEVAPDKLSVLYTLRKEARFHDGAPMTPDDVVWKIGRASCRERGGGVGAGGDVGR